VNKAELVDAVKSKTDMRKSEASKAVDAVFDAIAEALKGGDEVSLVGFGTFSMASRAASEERNPRTGEKRKIFASRSAKFAPLRILLDDALEKSEVARRKRVTTDMPSRGERATITAIDALVTSDTSKANSDDELNAALEAARSRGSGRVASILAREDMLSAEEFGKLIGVSRVTVNQKRQRREVLALEGARRGFRFPEWQIGENGKPFGALPELFDRLGGDPWEVYRFLVQHHPELGGLTGMEALRRGRVTEVIDAAESTLRAAS
jgi:nucleoid DNA-binding protein